MCGICGFVHADRQRPVSRDVLRTMNEAIVHRGPDSEGYHAERGVGLAMRRLSIIDLAGGDQPIYNEDGRVVIVFNGEIYNFHDLRRDLEGTHTFKTHTDTECIVHAYEEFGTECLERLNGMYAFALWDEERQQLLLARDRAGIKPLYWTEHEGTLVFASELKCLMRYPGLRREIDDRALDEYLTFEYVPAPRSIFRGVSKLAPGHALVWQAGRARTFRYWDLHLERSEGPHAVRRPFAESAGELWSVLKETVRRELISDVPVGIFLSGGIDSSSVAAAVRELGAPLRTFSIAFEDGSFDESPYARRVAQHLGADHHEMTLTAAMALELLPRLGPFMDEPLADSSFVPTFLLSKFARERVPVALGGDGGDEVFGGYSTLQAHRLMSLYQNVVPNPLRRAAEAVVGRLPTSFSNLSLDFKLKRFTQGDRLPFEVRHHYWLGSFDQEAKRAVVKRSAREPMDTFEGVTDHLRACAATEQLNRVLYLDMKMYLDGDILAKVDRASMAHSLEVRVPFLNRDVLQFAEALPVEYKLRGLTTKAILREAVRSRLPPEIVARGKKGFNMPVARWLTEDLREWAHDLLAYDRIARQGIFDARGVQQLLNDHMSRRRDARKQLWTLLAFQMWWDRWA
jgi:asparagine synthase (glutamine-hydrolysing)